LLKGDQIYNGAADNGSGTVACLAMADAFMQAKHQGIGPKRSMLFINFSVKKRVYLVFVLCEQRTVMDLNKIVAAITWMALEALIKIFS
jgi:predicted acetyltransferase